MKLAVALCIICWLAAPARADRADQVRADQLFKKGKKLLAEKHYAEACTAFEDSDRLDPGIGAKLNIAKCYEDWGKLATAWRWYGDAEGMASRARDERAKKIHALVEGLDASVPRLTVKLPPDASTQDVVIKLDGVELDAARLGNAQRVDPGPHQIDVIVAGVKQTRIVPVERGDRPEVTLDVPRKAQPRTRPTVEPRAPVAVTATSDPARTRRLLGLGITSGGGLLVVVAGTVTLRARSDYNYALANHCLGAIDMCDDRGLEVTHGARRRANISTGLTVVGLGAVATGLYFYFTAPRISRGDEHALYIAPQADGTGVVLGGAF